MNVIEKDNIVTIKFEDRELNSMLENLDIEIGKVSRGEFSAFYSFFNRYENMNILINFWISLKEEQIKMEHCE